ncbi:hypothetical protein DFH07DRAFT_1005700, partial [Mycena maculata]
MPSILNLKFKGNKSFVAFSNLNDTESLTKTWKVCTKVASYLEQGQRLENLLWHLQNLMVDTDNAKSKREFKKLSKCMGDKLDKEKGRSIEELPAPDFKRNPSTDLIRQRAVEKERTREASMHTPEHIIQRMQFTFAVDPPATSPSTTFTSASPSSANPSAHSAPNLDADGAPKRKRTAAETVRLPTLFSTSFGPAALLYPAPSLAPRMNYGEAAGQTGASDMRVARPTIELPLDELLCADDALGALAEEEGEAPNGHGHGDGSPYDAPLTLDPHAAFGHFHGAHGRGGGRHESPRGDGDAYFLADERDADAPVPAAASPASASVSASSVSASAHSTSAANAATTTTTNNNNATTAPYRYSLNFAASAMDADEGEEGEADVNSAPGGVKAECSNCGATHTPLWRRGLNDELNCNACGLYCKLHKRPRPKTMRNTGGGGEGRGQSVRAEAVDIMAQCYNCHTTATPLWRKDDEGKTVCNACGLYYKLHGAARPISMKSDVIRKRARHDARRGGGGGASVSVSETPTASPGVSRRASPAPDRASPTLAPDGTTTPHTYAAGAGAGAGSELAAALGPAPKPGPGGAYGHFPYHEAYPDALPFSNIDVSSEADAGARANKRRRMSVDSASEPPSSAGSFASYADGYGGGSAGSQYSLEFPFSRGGGGGAGMRGGGGANTFWHPPMLVQGEGGSPGTFQAGNSPGAFLHPPMLPAAEEAPMDYLHPPM